MFLLPQRIYSDLSRFIPKASFEHTSIIQQERMIKSQSEIQILQNAETLSEIGIEAAFETAANGKTEVEVAMAGVNAVRVHGADELPFPPEVFSGERTAWQAAQPSHRRLVHGDTLVINLGARISGYCGVLTRIGTIGTHFG